jgi:glutamate-1-semialdehyde 2,1-aminomutase
VAGLTHTVAYNDIASVEEALDHDTACLILEPTVFEEPRPGYLQQLLRLCHGRGALLIFDEMWTGFRCALGGAQERFGVTADLACFSKAIANGMPLSVLTGRGDIMRLLDREVFSYTTFGGEALSLAAAKATIEFMRSHDVPAYLERQGERIKQGYNDLALRLGMNEFTRCVGLGCRSMVVFESIGAAAAGEPLLQKSLVQQELFRRGVLWSGFHNLCFAHGDADVAHLLGAYAEVLPILREALATGTPASALLGDPVEPVFRKVTAFHSKPRPKTREGGLHAAR